jgi:hypothetical protein
MNVLNQATRAVVEGMSGSPEAEKRKQTYVDLIAVLIAFVITLVILAFIGQLLWNNVVVDLISVAKPAKSVWQILGLFIFWSLVRG